MNRQKHILARGIKFMIVGSKDARWQRAFHVGKRKLDDLIDDPGGGQRFSSKQTEQHPAAQ